MIETGCFVTIWASIVFPLIDQTHRIQKGNTLFKYFNTDLNRTTPTNKNTITTSNKNLICSGDLPAFKLSSTLKKLDCVLMRSSCLYIQCPGLSCLYLIKVVQGYINQFLKTSCTSNRLWCVCVRCHNLYWANCVLSLATFWCSHSHLWHEKIYEKCPFFSIFLSKALNKEPSHLSPTLQYFSMEFWPQFEANWTFCNIFPTFLCFNCTTNFNTDYIKPRGDFSNGTTSI